MPLLKDLNCSIELSDGSGPLQELGTVYGDAFVETFVPVPKEHQTFTVHLSGRNFIAPGIAMYVFIDGVYQCNRNRQNMKLRKPLDRRSLVDFKVRQKEERQKDGSMIAREWTFEKLDHASADGAPDSCSSNVLENLGCIEVVVLRCAGPRHAETAANMNMDGAADHPDYRHNRDSRSRTTAYDDRDPFVSAASHRLPSPPAAPQYRSAYAETVRSRAHSNNAGSRYSEPVSPGTRLQRDIPAPGFQYGSGPLPARSTAESYKALVGETPSRDVLKPATTIDSDVLGKIVADAVKRGVEESRKSEKSYVQRRTSSGEHHEDFEDSSQVPGAWPASPTRASKHRSNRSGPSRRHERDYDRDDNDSLWAQDATEEKRRPARSRSVSHIAWDQESEWDNQTKANIWGSPGEESWNTGETWSKARPGGWEEARQRSKSRARTARESSPFRRVSECSSQRRLSKNGRSQRSRSRSQSHSMDDMKTSSDDTDGWTQIEAPSNTSTSPGQSDSTLKPAHSHSQIQRDRSKPSRRSSRRERRQSRHQRRLSQLVENPLFQPQSLYQASPPSMLVTNAPAVVAAPVWQQPTDVRSRRPSAYTQLAAPVVAPPPTWGCASEKARKNSTATTHLPPAPFSTIGEDLRQSRRSSGSSSWGIENKRASKNGSEKKSSMDRPSWGENKNSDKASSTWGGAGNTAAGWSEYQAKGWDGDANKQKNDDWDTKAKGIHEWDVCNNTDEKPPDGWNTYNHAADWGQTDMKDVAVDGFNQDSNDNGWGHVDTSKDDQNNGGGFDETDDNGWGAVQDKTAAWEQPQDPANDVPFNADAGKACAAPMAVASKAPSKDKPASVSKRHASKSLSKYRQLSSPSLAKPHWQFPPTPPTKTLRPTTNEDASEHPGRTTRVPSVPSEPLYKVPHSAAADKGVEHQVLAGPGTAYGHAVSRPEYIDRLDRPYAVFRFKYRSRSVLESLFGKECLSKTGTAPRMSGKEDLEALPREELLRKMLALQNRLEEKDGGEESRCTESVARGWTQKWVQRLSREASETGKKARTEKSAEKVGAWDDGAKRWNPEKAGVKW
ncbi:hypothetical protein E8E12_002509 [Didymella heteroderae]|uniref:DUF7918 domain-containing protein n=1 Tax=Didymella heteroderae TaxID=1769908 RepID=A0A9P4WQG7_9PLEO|nr:hypothetical protein E8E12_002509 [Didymella heteroderae]